MEERIAEALAKEIIKQIDNAPITYQSKMIVANKVITKLGDKYSIDTSSAIRMNGED